MQIFYPEVCASSLGSFNELVVKQNFPSTESIHIFKKTYFAYQWNVHKLWNEEKRNSYLKKFETCWNSIWQLTFLTNKTRGRYIKKAEKKKQMLKSFKTISCSMKKLCLRNKHSAEKHTSKELGESGLKTCVIALLRIYDDEYVHRK